MWKTGTEIKRLARYATAKFRALPDFIIIGAMKGGTTTLFSALARHPKIMRSFTKETHFFNHHYHKGLTWYRSNFPLTRELAEGCKTGEATPQYLYHTLVPERIRKTVPDVKLIVMLRDPTERTISHYFHEVRKKREKRPILKALGEEEEMLQKILAAKDFDNALYTQAAYKQRSVYHDQIKRFLRYFPREQLLVLGSETFFADPPKGMDTVFRFLGVAPDFQIGRLQHKNIGWNRTQVAPEVYTYLNDYFAPHNQALFDLLGRTFPWA